MVVLLNVEHADRSADRQEENSFQPLTMYDFILHKNFGSIQGTLKAKQQRRTDGTFWAHKKSRNIMLSGAKSKTRVPPLEQVGMRKEEVELEAHGRTRRHQ